MELSFILLYFLVLIVFPGTMAYAAASDLMTMTISNRLQLLLVASFALAAPLAGLSLETIGWHVLAGFTVLLVSFTLFAFGWIGGGDAKLVAVTTLWFGFGQNLMEYLLYSSLMGGALTVGLLAMRSYPMPAFLLHHTWAMRLHNRDSGVPYGIALAFAALLVLPNTFWMTQVLK